MSKNSEILNNWKKDILNYPHLKFSEAVSLYKQGKRNEVICGTLYKMYDFISKDILKEISSSSYDLEDIISSVTIAWIEVLDEGILDKVTNFSQIYCSSSFYKRISDKLVNIINLQNANLGCINFNNFNNYFKLYLDLKKKKDNINYLDFLKYVRECYLKDCELYYVLDYAKDSYGYWYACANIDRMLIIFNSIYSNLNLDNNDISLNKTTISNFKYLFLDLGLNFENLEEDLLYVDDYCLDRYIREDIRKTLEESEIEDRIKKIIRLRYGFDDDRPKALDEVAKEFGLTRERIRQLEANGLRKLRHPSTSKKLRGYL